MPKEVFREHLRCLSFTVRDRSPKVLGTKFSVLWSPCVLAPAWGEGCVLESPSPSLTLRLEPRDP